MKNSKLLVFCNAADGKDEEFNHWYDTIHIGEVCEVPGFAGAERFKITDNEGGAPEYRYLTIYEMVSDDSQQALAELARRAQSGDFRMSDALGNTKLVLVEALSQG